MKLVILSRWSIILLALVCLLAIFSCEKETVEEDEFLTELTDQGDQLEQRSRNRCFELVFPVNVKMPDGSIILVESKDSLKRILKGYCFASADRKMRPELDFPVIIKTKDGVEIKVASKEELKALRKDCFSDYLDSLRQKYDPCIEIIYPIEIRKSDGTIMAIASKEELKAYVILLKNENQGRRKRKMKLEIIFPIQVMEDEGKISSVGSMDELRDKMKGCTD